jgi:transcriptional regulator with PAS, ATPase and Fis domain
MRDVVSLVQRIAGSTASVLITGESGTGKELVARGIHYNSPRAGGPFVGVNLAAVPEGLIESELFGHKKGAFTDARSDKPGLFVEADAGTIFLDEIGELAMPLQAKLLRVLQEHEVRPLGATKNTRVDVRVIAATNRNLDTMRADGSFREDLYYRLNVIPITLPPLRERREDIPLLTETFLKRFYQRRDQPPRPLSPGVLQAFMRYPWPGNVRELENACERIAQTCTCDTVKIGCVPVSVLFHRNTEDAEPVLETHAHPSSVSLEDRLRDVEQGLITWALKVSGGNKSKAAELLQIKRSTLGDRIKRLGLPDSGGDDSGRPASAD